MTTSATTAWEPTAAHIIRLALLELGILHTADQADVDQIAFGMDIISLGLNHLITRGVLLHKVERYAQTLTSGTASYAAPSDTESVEGTATCMDTAGLESPVESISQAKYMTITDKTVSGRPIQFYAEKTGTNAYTIFLFPVPDSTVTTFTYVRTKKFFDTDNGAVTLDVPRKFIEPMVALCKWKFAGHYKMSDVRVKSMKDVYDAEVEMAIADENQHGSLQFVVPELFAR